MFESNSMYGMYSLNHQGAFPYQHRYDVLQLYQKKNYIIACRPGTPMLLENGPYIFTEASRSASEICCQWNEEADGI